MIALFWCAVICQNIEYWEVHDRIDWCGKITPANILKIMEYDGFRYDYGFTVQTYGASLQQCHRVTAEEHLRILGYFVEFDGDGKICR